MAKKKLGYQIPLQFAKVNEVDQSTLKQYETSNSNKPIPLSRLPIMRWSKGGACLLLQPTNRFNDTETYREIIQWLNIHHYNKHQIHYSLTT